MVQNKIRLIKEEIKLEIGIIEGTMGMFMHIRLFMIPFSAECNIYNEGKQAKYSCDKSFWNRLHGH
jgi:hypothetical protein